MHLEVTPEAAEVLNRSLELGAASKTDGAGIRLRAAHALGGGAEVQVELADGPQSGEEVQEHAGLTFFVDPAVFDLVPHPVVTLEPQHEVVVVRPADRPG